MAYVYKREESPFYQACIKVGGREVRFSTKSRSRAVAESTAEKRECEENTRLAEHDTPTLVDMADRMFEERGDNGDLSPNTISAYKGALRNIYRVLGDFHLGVLSEDMVRTYIHEKKRTRPKGERDVGIIKDLAFLSSLLTYASTQEDYRRPNWLRSVRPKELGLTPAREKEGFLTETEVARLYAACTEDYQRLFVILSVECGTRRNETLSLEWAEIDLASRVIIFRGKRRTKNGKVREIPLTTRVRKMLQNTKATQKGSSRFVFPGRKDDTHLTTIKTTWKTLTKNAKLTGVTIHDLRHTYASWAKQRGLEDSAIQSIMGHSTPSMTRRYSKHSRESLSRAVKQFEKPGYYTMDYTKAHKCNKPMLEAAE